MSETEKMSEEIDKDQNNVVDPPAAPKKVESLNSTIVKYFWYYAWVSFASQCIVYLMMCMSAVISPWVLLILCLGAANTILLGSFAKLLRKIISFNEIL